MGNKTSSHPDYTEDWTRNSVAKACEKCESVFTVTIRRHHCRKCGGCFCHSCSSRKTVLSKNSLPKRVCDNCYKNVNLNTAIKAGYGGDLKEQLFKMIETSIDLYNKECACENGKPWIFSVSKEKYMIGAEGFGSLLGLGHPLCVVIQKLGMAMEKGEDLSSLAKEFVDTMQQSATERNRILSESTTKEIQTFVNLFETLPDLKSVGKIDEAKEVAERVVKGFEYLCGPDDARTITAINALAGITMTAGDMDEAERLFRRALEGREKLFGADHQQTLNTVNNLATVLFEKKQFEAAADLYQRAYEGYKLTLGDDHSSVASAKENLELARLSLHTSKNG